MTSLVSSLVVSSGVVSASFEWVERGRSREKTNVRQRSFDKIQTENVVNLLRWVTSGPPLQNKRKSVKMMMEVYKIY